MERLITSSQNKVLKSLVSLRDNKTRRKGTEFSVEGFREIKQALDNGYKISKVCICLEDMTQEEKNFLKNRSFDQNLIWNFSKNCFEKLLVRKNSSGLFFVFYKKEAPKFTPSKNGLYLILDGLEKPSNLGAILRSSDAAGVDHVFLTNSSIDLYHPNVIRNSLGAAFTVSCSSIEEKDLYSMLSSEKIKIYSSFLHSESKSYHLENYKQSSAFVLGSEAQGISQFWQENSYKKIIIPMLGQVDSLNVSTASAILLFEANRQRL